MKANPVLGAMLVVVGLTACSPPLLSSDELPAPPFETPLPSFDREEETYQVYIAAMSNWCTDWPIALDPNSPGIDPNSASHFEGAVGLDYDGFKVRFRYSDDVRTAFERSTFEEFISTEPLNSFVLQADYVYGRTVDLMTFKEFLVFIDEQGGWDSMFNESPSYCGHATLSRVGFDETGTQAMVRFIGIGGEWCIEEFLLLDKQDSEWEIVADLVSTIC